MNIEEENNRIILITCSRTDNNKQLIVEGKLVNKDVK